jgi:hypothetical protein
VQGKSAFNCPICGAFGEQTWYSLHRALRSEGNHPASVEWSADAVTPPGFMSTPDPWFQAQCRACKKFHTWRRNRLIYPQASTVPLARAEMPDAAKALYLEAREVVAVSKRAGLALARSTLELLLKVLLPDAPKGSNLEALTVLAEPEVSVGLAVRMHAARRR